MTKYKNRLTGAEVVFEDSYLNSNSVIPLIESLYANSSEWVKIFPIDKTNAASFAHDFAESHCRGVGSTWTEDYKTGVKKGVEAYIKSQLK